MKRPGPFFTQGSVFSFLTCFLVLSPLLVSLPSLDPFLFPKSILLWGTASLLAAFLFAGPVSRPDLRTSSGWATIGFLLIPLTAVASGLSGLSPLTSFRGAEGSFGGLVSLTSCTIVFLTARLMGTDALARDAARHAILAGVTGAAAYAIGQAAGLDPIAWRSVAEFSGSVRPMATMGHANHAGALFAMGLPFALKAVDEARRKSKSARLLAAAALVLLVTALAVTASRGAWLAAIVGVVVFLSSRRGVEPPDKRTFRFSTQGVAALAGLLCAFIVLAATGRLENAADRIMGFTEIGGRTEIWKAGLAVFSSNPYMGCGTDTFHLAFPGYRTDEFWKIESDRTPLHAHNEVLNLLATQGLLGLLPYALIVAGFLYSLLRKELPRQEHLDADASDMGSLAAWIAHGVAGFSVVPLGAIAAAIAGLACRPSAELSEERPGGFAPRKGLWAGILLAAATMAANLCYPGVFRSTWPGLLPLLLIVGGALLGALASDQHSRDAGARRPSSGGSRTPSRVKGRRLGWIRISLGTLFATACLAVLGIVATADAFARRGENSPPGLLGDFRLSTQLDPWRELLQTLHGEAALKAARFATEATERVAFLAEAQVRFQAALALTPPNPLNHLNIARVKFEMALAGLGVREAPFRWYDEAILRDPRNSSFLADAATAALRLGDVERAMAYATENSRHHPAFGLPAGQLGQALISRGDSARALRILKKAAIMDWQENSKALALTEANIAGLLGAAGEFEEAEKHARRAVELDADCRAGNLNLAAILEKQGRVNQAITIYGALLERDPEDVAARAALSRLRSGSGP